ncbi:hypothetical protein EDD66_106158 [Mobilisporobacter senegalensis]|uniref:Uncharacterized protein n=1 Tax=Mobilisporobacter senegalensis TaxID=1329262 RepID=A0A3N1XMV2_9FIRM|nr:hypothetical protein [Mobilisporobacter senegalensis]ROR27461.1 hypothetical protein EDD66_106158 [Mobilisporobacter senegalensis]
MSAFLGPIHFWLYNKIQIQNDLVEDIIALSEQKIPGFNLRMELENKYGVTETRALEQVIDEGNIHGWLQSLVSQVEYKLAYSVTILLEKNRELLTELEEIFFTRGNETSSAEESAAVIYKAISDSLLDGMPCDHANSVIEGDEELVKWKRNTCVHKQYWNEIGGDVNNYYILREAFIRGFISETNFEYIKVDEVTSMIKSRKQIGGL